MDENAEHPQRVAQILSTHAQALDEYLQAAISSQQNAPARLLEAMRYSLFAGGKRLRPALVLECCTALRGDVNGALPAAGAVELVHTFSLIHDDLPAMDDDDLRRGRPTNHKVFGEALAILAGDAMVALAFEILAKDAPPNLAPQLVSELARATGSAGMIGGQARDIENENKAITLDELREMHRMKTGALISASCRMGAICANADARSLAAITDFASHLGLAFQIADDLLDQTATREQAGKQTNKDAARGKNTYPLLLGPARAHDAANNELQSALAALQSLNGSTANLAMLARFVVNRDR